MKVIDDTTQEEVKLERGKERLEETEKNVKMK